jgi:hypothetical protein
MRAIYVAMPRAANSQLWISERRADRPMDNVPMDALVPLRSLALPFRVAPLVLVATFSLLLALAMKAGLWGIPMLVILGSWFFKYCFMLLDHTAQGRTGAPVLTPEAANPVGEMRPLAYAFLIGTFYLATFKLGQAFDPLLASALRLVALLALPAVVATHTITGSLTEALNPRTISITTYRLGASYFVILLLSVGCWWLGRAILLDAGGLSLLIRTALLMFVWMLLFSALGGVIHARRDELEFEPEHSLERTQRRDDRELGRERDRFMDQVFAEFRSGNSGNAWESIQKRAAQSGDAVAEYLWIYERAAGWPNQRLANKLAEELLPMLLVAKRNEQAFRIVRSRVKADPAFRPQAGSLVVRLAELSRDAGDRPLARLLLDNFESRFPQDPARDRARQLMDQLER